MIRTTRPVLALVMLAASAVLLTGCQQPARPRASLAATAACRAEVDRVYAAQNRVDLSTRDQRDTPFAGSYNSGITSAGLSSRYGRDTMESSCLANATASAAPQPTLSLKPAR